MSLPKLPRLRAKRTRKGWNYWFDHGGKPRRWEPLGSDENIVRRRYDDLIEGRTWSDNEQGDAGQRGLRPMWQTQMTEDRKTLALALWVEWFKPRVEGTGIHKHTIIPSPFISVGYNEDSVCFFCGHDEVAPEDGPHEPDCIYVRAKAIIENAT